MSDEEMVAVNLGDDYDKGPYFTTDWGSLDYLVPRSQMERWEAAQAAWEAVQSEIDQVVDEQRERVLASRPKTPETALSKAIKDIYGPALQQQLERDAYLNRVIRGEGE